MKERPILMKSHEIKGILEKRKTQFRRIINPQPIGEDLRILSNHYDCMIGDDKKYWGLTAGDQNWEQTSLQCPYGVDEIRDYNGSLIRSGDRLWVRETMVRWLGDGTCGNEWVYKADGSHVIGSDSIRVSNNVCPSIHMPRWASRITLEVMSVKVERLQDISEEDAKEEGAFFTDYGRTCYHTWDGPDACPAPPEHHQQKNGWAMQGTSSSDQCLGSARMAFANLWQSINGPGSWETNPWVWVVTFRSL